MLSEKRQQQIFLYCISFMKHMQNDKTIEMGNRWVVARRKGQGGGWVSL